MTSSPDYYATLLAGELDLESITVLVVTGATADEVATALRVDTSAEPTEYPQSADEDIELSDYALTVIDGGVLAFEHTGYADPGLDVLRTLSRGGRRAAVTRSNIQGRVRFGCARDGEVLFDDDEFAYTEDPDQVPAELRPLFDLAWDDLEDEEIDEEGEVPLLVGLAMTEEFTGLRPTEDDFRRAMAAGYRPAPSLQYAPED